MSSYFDPKPFELVGRRSIYRRFGVAFFKRYLLLTDLLMFRAGRMPQLNLASRGRESEIERLEWQTRRDETIHLVGMAAIVIMAAVGHAGISAAGWVAIFFVNLYFNVYPIMVQRHNRIRLRRIGRALASRTSRAAEPGAGDGVGSG